MYQNIIGKPTETSYTDVEGIKEGSFHYVEQVNEEGNLRYGSVISSYVEFEVYENNPSFAVGDELYYIQRTDQSKTFEDGAIRNIKINTFIVKTVEKFKTTYKYTAYDYISKLDVDVSSELLALKDSFPLTAAIILSSYISHWCSIRIDWSSLYWYTGSNTYVPTIPFFYYNGITARDIVARLAELNSQFVVAVQHQGYVQIEFQSSTGYSNWDSLSNMIICPTDLIDYYGTGSQSETKLIPIWYKENGLNKADYTCAVLNRAIIRRNSGEIVYDSDDDAWQPLPSGDNVYTIYGNYIAESLYDAGTSGINMFYSCRANVARILNYNITPMTVKLFPFRNPYRAGNIIQNMADADGNRFASFAMKMEITDESATLYCYGDEKYQPYSGDDISSLRASVESNIEEVRDGKVSKSGDTMTGSLYIDGRALPSAGSYRTFRIYGNKKSKPSEVPTVTSNSPYGSISMYDVDDNRLFYNECVLNSSKTVYASYVVRRPMDDGTFVGNGFYLRVHSDGTVSVSFNTDDTKKAWVSALGLGTSGSLPITIAQGGTGATTRTNAVKALFNEAPANDTQFLLGIKGDWSKAGYVGFQRVRSLMGLGNTTGALPIANGGTGQTAVTTVTTISSIATAATGCTIKEAEYAQFGKVAQLRLAIKKTAAVSSGQTTLATVVSGKRPVYGTGGATLWSRDKLFYFQENGVIAVNGPIAANETIYVLATYILP